MLSQYKLLFLVWILQALEMLVFYALLWTGSSLHDAGDGVQTVAFLMILSNGFNNMQGRERKAQSKTGAPRLSLASDLWLWCGFGTITAVAFGASLGNLASPWDYARAILQLAVIGAMVTLAARAISAEVLYDSRKYPPGILYLPFLTVAIALPAMLAVLPAWLAGAFVAFQVLIMLVLTVSPWKPIAKTRSAS